MSILTQMGSIGANYKMKDEIIPMGTIKHRLPY